MTRDQKILKYMPLVEKVAAKKAFSFPSLELEELVQFGTLGLIHAVDNYDRSRGDFAAYAWVCIEGAILDEINEEGGMKLIQQPKSKEPIEVSLVGGSDEIEILDKNNNMVFNHVITPSPLDILLLEEMKDTLNETLSGMPPEQEQVIKLVVVEGMSLSAASIELGISRDKLTQYFDGGMAVLREAFGGDML
jgi:RNA polymerase sigma factor (sigma-70 family)